jgi:hypothetical protein
MIDRLTGKKFLFHCVDFCVENALSPRILISNFLGATPNSKEDREREKKGKEEASGGRRKETRYEAIQWPNFSRVSRDATGRNQESKEHI